MRTFLISIIFFMSISSFSQDYKFGKVHKEELLSNHDEFDSAANATVLYKKQEIYYEFSANDGFTQINEVYERIKIYNKEGYDFATQKIRLYDESLTKRQEIKGLKGYTYTLNGNKVEKSKLKDESVFEEKVNDYWTLLKFTMPNINDGVIIEFQYSIVSPFISIDDVILQYQIPIRKLDFEARIPEYFNFNKLLNPKSTYIPKVSELEYERVENTYNRNRTTGGWSGTRSGPTEASEWKFKERKTEIHETNIPAIIDEPFVDNLKNYQTKLVWEYAFFKGLNGQIETYATSWDKVVETIYKNDDFGGQLNKTSYFKDDLDNILNGIEDPLQKAMLIFNHVKSKVKWNNYLGYSSNNGVKNAYKEGEGNVADINLMLTSMLRYAGLTANPVLVSTRDNGIPILPTRSGFNYVISAIEVPDGLILLDASNSFSSPNIIPKRVLNWQGRIIREHGSSAWVSLSPNQLSKEIVSFNVKINDDLSIDGKVRSVLTNHLALGYREDFYNLNSDLRIQKLEEDNGDVAIANLEIVNESEFHKPINYAYDYHLENSVEKIGDKIYFSPLLFLTPKENPFKQDTRNYPIDLVYPLSEKHTVNIMLPDGYVVDALPENMKIEFNGNEGEFTYLAKNNGNMLQFVINLNLNKTIILPNAYKEFKKFFELLIEKESEKVVLKKV